MPAASHGQRRPRSAPLSEALEDYLEIILDLSARHDVVRIRDVARARAVRMPTAVIALRRLTERGLVRYAAGDHAALTPAGARRARQLAARHAFLERFLRDILGLPARTAAQDACGLEHHLAPATLERLCAFVESIETCPAMGAEFARCFRTPVPEGAPAETCGVHLQDPVSAAEPGRRSEKTTGGLSALIALPDGERGTIAQLRAPSRLRRVLLERGLLPRQTLVVLRAGGTEGTTRLRVAGRVLTLTPAQARAVYVRLAPRPCPAPEKGENAPRSSAGDRARTLPATGRGRCHGGSR
jgi:Mn-dependent DtxR family transcriptional regulator/Fe2+ transport system protein FeoA